MTVRFPLQTYTCVTGVSGSGKSTLARLMFRFYDLDRVTGGAITIDGQDIRDVAQDSLRASIGIVPQDTVLFNDTIGYNIAYGRPEATEDEILAAAKAAYVDRFVHSLPEGYDTVIEHDGIIFGCAALHPYPEARTAESAARVEEWAAAQG